MTKVMLVDDDASMQVLIEQIVRLLLCGQRGRRPGDAEGRAPRLPYS